MLHHLVFSFLHWGETPRSPPAVPRNVLRIRKPYVSYTTSIQKRLRHSLEQYDASLQLPQLLVPSFKYTRHRVLSPRASTTWGLVLKLHILSVVSSSKLTSPIPIPEITTAERRENHGCFIGSICISEDGWFGDVA